MDKYKQIFSNTAIFALSNILSKIVLSLLLPLYTRVLTPEEYGTAELLTTIVQLAIPICSVAIQDAVFRYSMDKKGKSENVLKASLVILCGATVGLFVVSIVLKAYRPISEWSYYFFAISVLTMLRSVCSLYVKATNKTWIFSIDNFLYNAILAGCNVLFLLCLDFGLDGYFIAMVCANTISLLYLLIAGKIWQDISKAVFEKKLLKEMLIYSLPLVLNSISWGLTHLVDKVMLTNYCTASATGVYSAASKVPSILSLVTGVFAQAWAISAIQEFEGEKDKRFYENIFFITHIGVIICTLGLFIINNNILLFVLGEDFAESIKYIPVLLIGSVFLTYSNFYSPIYSAMKKSKQIMYSAFGGMLINVVLNAILIPQNGIMGACIATAVSYIFIAIFRMIESRRYFKIKLSIKSWSLSIIVLMISGICVVYDYYSIIMSLVSIFVIVFIYKNQLKNLVYKILKRSK